MLSLQVMHDLMADGLEKSKLLYVNFEDERLSDMKKENFQDILHAYLLEATFFFWTGSSTGFPIEKSVKELSMCFVRYVIVTFLSS